MEKYDRDVEQKQHELDVLKVCIHLYPRSNGNLVKY